MLVLSVEPLVYTADVRHKGIEMAVYVIILVPVATGRMNDNVIHWNNFQVITRTNENIRLFAFI